MHRRIVLLVALLLAVGLTAGVARAQIDILSGKRLQPRKGQVFGVVDDAPKFTARAEILPAEAEQKPRLSITIDVTPGWHTYSITQAPGGPTQTQIKLDPASGYRLAGPFVATPPPQKHTYPDIWPGVVAEEHSGTVTWWAPIEIAPGTDPCSSRFTAAWWRRRATRTLACRPPRRRSRLRWPNLPHAPDSPAPEHRVPASRAPDRPPAAMREG